MSLLCCNGATCSVSGRLYNCTCKLGWTGNKCERRDNCKPYTCHQSTTVQQVRVHTHAHVQRGHDTIGRTTVHLIHVHIVEHVKQQWDNTHVYVRQVRLVRLDAFKTSAEAIHVIIGECVQTPILVTAALTRVTHLKINKSYIHM